MAKGLALKGFRVILLCRNLSKAKKARMRIRETGAPLPPEIFIADLSSFITLRDAIRKIQDSYQKIDVLINNAGSIYLKRKQTLDGFECNFQVSYLAHFLLSLAMEPLLSQAQSGRVITVVGEFHSKYPMNWEDLQAEKKYSAMRAGSRAQLAKLLFTKELARRWQAKGITSNAYHPGAVRTKLTNHLGFPLKYLARLALPFMLSPVKGAETGIWLACNPDVAGVSGKYFIKKRQVKPADTALSEEDAIRLWELSEKLCGFDPQNQAL